jgi:hypothetical protein
MMLQFSKLNCSPNIITKIKSKTEIRAKRLAYMKLEVREED